MHYFDYSFLENGFMPANIEVKDGDLSSIRIDTVPAGDTAEKNQGS